MSAWTNKFIQVNQYTRPGTKLKVVKKLAIHYTANPGAGADNHYRYFNSSAIQQKRYASAHIFADRNKALCIIPVDEVAYHANDGTKRNVLELRPNANLSSIGVEMCLERDGHIHVETIARTVKVIAELCRRYNLDPINDIVRHFDITGKNCPAPWVSNEKAFISFKNTVRDELNRKQTQESDDTLQFTSAAAQKQFKNKVKWMVENGHANKIWLERIEQGTLKTGDAIALTMMYMDAK